MNLLSGPERRSHGKDNRPTHDRASPEGNPHQRTRTLETTPRSSCRETFHGGRFSLVLHPSRLRSTSPCVWYSTLRGGDERPRAFGTPLRWIASHARMLVVFSISYRLDFLTSSTVIYPLVFSMLRACFQVVHGYLPFGFLDFENVFSSRPILCALQPQSKCSRGLVQSRKSI